MAEPQGSTRRALLAAAVAGVAALDASRAHAASSDPVAKTGAGLVRGTVEGGVRVFRGVRYGADTGPRRFRPPSRPQPWADTLAATAYGPASPQRSKAEPTSEDCLFLNVWTPGLRDGAKRPVIVYFHGGAHASGSGSSPLYDGGNLCRRGDVVVVTVNHRLNAFGYAYLGRVAGPDYASANVGTLDLVLALQWVRDNIAEFGGDPGRVMVFGQSGGGGKVDTLMAMPAAAGLLHRAATMSGSQLVASGPLGATRKTVAYMKTLGLAPDQGRLLATLPLARLVEALDTADPDAADERIIWGPVLDHLTLPRHPFYPDAPPQSAAVPMIIGSTHDETRYFLRNDAKAFDLSWDELPAKLAKEMVADIGPEFVIARYRQLYPDYTPSQLLFAASTAGRSWRGHLNKAEIRSRQGRNTWAYQLDYGSPVEGGKYGAMHTLDIPLVFDNVDKPGSMTGTDAAARAMAAQMSATFIAFARSGDPNNAALPVWPAFDETNRPTLVFDRRTRVENDPRAEERKLFALVPYLKPGT
ncbi:MAG: pnbA [Caulobacter sp.]|nr:pnbA [Caulobacter sp.]